MHNATGLRKMLGGAFELDHRARLPALEGLRGFSALLVFFVHFNALFGARQPQIYADTVLGFLGIVGHCGVDIFFALSGFLIYGAVLNGSTGYWDFVKRRIVRLYPAFLAVFVLYVAGSFTVPEYSRIPGALLGRITYLAANLLMLPGIFPIVPMITVAWSLSYELAFYLTLPLVMRGLGIDRWSPWKRSVFFLVLAGAHLLLWNAGLVKHPRMVMFSCGILARETFRFDLWKQPAIQFLAAGSFVAALVLMGLTGEPIVARYCGPFLSSSVGNLVVLFGATFLLLCVSLEGSGIVGRFFDMTWLRWLGNMSYSYYLAHGALLHIIRAARDAAGIPAHSNSLEMAALCVGAFAFTVIGSAVLFLAVERPLSLPRRRGAGAELQPLPRIAQEATV